LIHFASNGKSENITVRGLLPCRRKKREKKTLEREILAVK